MKRSPLPVDELIRRFQNNECTPDEIRLLQQWLTQLDISGDSTQLSSEQLAAIKDRMYRQLMTPAPVVKLHRRIIRRRFLAAAGWLVLIASSILLWYTFRKTGVNSRQTPILTTITNNNGVKRITLPDGTVVSLNRHSQLVFDAHEYNRQQRLVKLSGEGFFEVEKDPSRPFIVETGRLHTRVLGTAFNIEAYHNESEIRVSLVHGKIALDETVTDQTTLLSPDQTFRYVKQSGTWEILPVVAQQVALWTQGWLVFNELPLQEAIERIEERYKLVIEYKPALIRNKRITSSFQTAPWQVVLENILFVHGLHYRQANGKIIIVKRER
jgi:transmembrane sensor